MARAVIGLDFGDHFIKLVELKRKGRKVYVSEVMHFPTPRNSIVNGELIGIDRLARSLQQLIESSSFTSRNVVFGVPAEQSFTKVFRIPAMFKIRGKADLLDILREDIEGEFNIQLENVYFDLQIVGQVEGEEGTELLVMFAYAPKRIVDAYLELLRDLKLRVIAADAELLAETRTLYLLPEYNSAATTVMLNISSNSTSVAFYEDNAIKYTRVIETGASVFIKQVSEYKGISVKEAEYIMNQKDILSEEKPELRQIIAGSLKNLTRELRRVISYYRSQLSSGDREYLGVLSGGGAMLKGFDRALSEELGFPIVINRALTYLPPSEPDRLSPSVLEDMAPIASVALGLAMYEFADLLFPAKG